jgi:hypothetical protein
VKAQFGPEAVIYDDGTLARSVPVDIYVSTTLTHATIYEDSAGAVIGSNPVLTDALGNLQFFTEPGTYDIVLNGGVLTVVVDTPGGSGGGGTSLVHTQSTPSASWAIPHLLGRIPNVQVYITGAAVIADIAATNSLVSVTFPSAVSGVAVLV